MNDRPETSSSGRQWVEKAEHDLINAEHTLKLGGGDDAKH